MPQRERRRLRHQVVVRELDQGADLVADDVVAVAVRAQPARHGARLGQVDGATGVASGARDVERSGGDVGADDADRRRRYARRQRQPFARLEREHGERVRLLAGRAARAPDRDTTSLAGGRRPARTGAGDRAARRSAAARGGSASPGWSRRRGGAGARPPRRVGRGAARSWRRRDVRWRAAARPSRRTATAGGTRRTPARRCRAGSRCRRAKSASLSGVIAHPRPGHRRARSGRPLPRPRRRSNPTTARRRRRRPAGPRPACPTRRCSPRPGRW